MHMLVGERLKEARRKHHITQESLGKLIGVSKSAISLYESEKRNPTLENIVELMYVLGVSADYLLGVDMIAEIKNLSKPPKYATLTKEEVEFINYLKKDKIYYEMLLLDPKRGIEIIKTRL